MKFSLIIPLAPERGAEIIESIKRLDYPRSDFHVVVVRGKNPSENRNRGAEKARGEIIVFLDDDAVISEDYLNQIERFFERNPEMDIVGGPQLTPGDETGFAKISGHALSSRFGAWKIADRYCPTEENCDVDETCLTSANLICKKYVMDRVRFNPRLFPGEDPKFISDAKKRGFKVGYSPSIVIYHRRRPTIKGFVKQIFSYGKTRTMKESFIETLKFPFFFIPSIFLIYIVVLLGWILSNPSITGGAIGTNRTFTLFLSPLAIYVLFSLGFAIYDSLKNKDYKAPLVLPLIYPIIHLSYGAGMIWGYIKKVK